MWFSGQSAVDARTWSGGHGYGAHVRSWGAFCEGEGEVFRVLGCRQKQSHVLKRLLNDDIVFSIMKNPQTNTRSKKAKGYIIIYNSQRAQHVSNICTHCKSPLPNPKHFLL